MKLYTPTPENTPVQKIVQEVGDGENHDYSIQHTLGPHVTARFYRTADGEDIYMSYKTTEDSVELHFNLLEPPSLGEITVVIFG